MIKTLIILFVAFGVNISLNAQTKYFQEYGKCRILTEPEFKKQQEILQLKFKKTSPNAKVAFDIVEETETKDSILMIYQTKVKLNENLSLNLNSHKEKVFEMLHRKFPDFALEALNGETVKLEDLRGKPIVFNFWFNACGPCKMEMPVLNQIREEYKDRVNFVSVTFNNREEVEKVLESNRFNFKHLINASQLIDSLSVSAYPKTLIINKNGIIKQIMECVDSDIDEKGHVVLGNGDELRKEIDKLLYPLEE